MSSQHTASQSVEESASRAAESAAIAAHETYRVRLGAGPPWAELDEETRNTWRRVALAARNAAAGVELGDKMAAWQRRADAMEAEQRAEAERLAGEAETL